MLGLDKKKREPFGFVELLHKDYFCNLSIVKGLIMSVFQTCFKGPNMTSFISPKMKTTFFSFFKFPGIKFDKLPNMRDQTCNFHKLFFQGSNVTTFEFLRTKNDFSSKNIPPGTKSVIY